MTILFWTFLALSVASLLMVFPTNLRIWAVISAVFALLAIACALKS